MKYLQLLLIWIIALSIPDYVDAGYTIFDINGTNIESEPITLAGKTNSTYIRNKKNRYVNFVVSGNTAATARWYIPVNLAISSGCKLHFNISSTNIRSFHSNWSLYLVMRTGQDRLQGNIGDRQDNSERSPTRKKIPVFKAAGSKDSAIGWLPLEPRNETVFIEGFYVDVGLIACCDGELTVSDLRIVSEGNLLPKDEVEAILSTPPPVRAEIKRRDNLGLVLSINGVAQSGLGYSCGNHVHNSHYGVFVGECNTNITRAFLNFGGRSPFFSNLKPVWMRPGYIDFHQIDRLLKKACLGTDTYAIVDVLLHTPPDWWIDQRLSAHAQPSRNGSESNSDYLIRAVHTAETMNSKGIESSTDLQISDLDPSWRNYCEDALRQLFAYIRKQPYADKIVGCNVIFGIGMNDYPLPNRDSHPDYVKSFREWLRRKHWDVDTLRDSWQSKTVTFTQAKPIRQEHWSKGDIFSFIHPIGGGQAADSHAFYQASWADTLLFHCELIKSLTHGRYLTGIIGGPALIFNSLWNNSYQPTSDSVNPILKSKDVDYVEVPVDSMDVRNGHGANGTEAVLKDELRQHDKLLFLRNQVPFYASNRQKAVTNNREDLIQIQRRIFVAALVNNAPMFFVQTGDDEYEQAFVKEEIKRFQAISRKALKVTKRRRSEIAFVVDFDTFKYLAPDRRRTLIAAENSDFHKAKTHEIPYLAPQASHYFHLLGTPRLLWNRIGAPYDIVSIDQFEPDPYKTVVLFNTLRLTEKREKIINECKSGHRYLVSMWANGFVADRYLSIRGAKRITGMSVQMVPKRTRFDAKVLPGLETFLNRTIKSSSIGWLYVFREGGNADDPLLGPTFYVDDEETMTLAKYIDNHAPSMAVRYFPEWTSVYSASPVIYPEIAREILRKSNVHIYLNSNDLVFINDSFIGIHTLDSGVRQLNLPEESALYEVFRKYDLKRNKIHSLKLTGKKTYLFYRGNKQDWDSL